MVDEVNHFADVLPLNCYLFIYVEVHVQCTAKEVSFEC